MEAVIKCDARIHLRVSQGDEVIFETVPEGITLEAEYDTPLSKSTALAKLINKLNIKAPSGETIKATVVNNDSTKKP